jgi:cell wall-associated NlpC family hydrolase
LGTGCASPATRLRADQAEETGAANAQGSRSGRSPTRQGSLSTPQREHLISLARKFLGQTSIQVGRKKYPADCTGFVRALFDPLGINLMANARRGDNGVQAIYRYAQAHGEVYMRRAPEPGDLVFFRETYDRNRDGRQNDGLTHVGLVDGVSDDGTVSVIHRVKRGVVRYRMNLQHADIHIDPRTRQTLNDYIKTGSGNTRAILTGQLFAAYGAVLPSTLNVARRP